MEQKEIIYTKKDVIEYYKPMFTERSLSKIIREGKKKHISEGRRIFIPKKAEEEYKKNKEESSLRESLHIL